MNIFTNAILIPYLMPLLSSSISYLIEYSNTKGVLLNRLNKREYSKSVDVTQHFGIFTLSHSLWGITYTYSKNNEMALLYVAFLLWSFTLMLHANIKTISSKYFYIHFSIFLILSIVIRIYLFKAFEL
jgi:hypothetical protein